MMPFVWSMIGEDAGEKLVHIIARKEAERLAGAGQFWWGLGTPLGEDVERQAILNGRALHALFSEPKKARPIDPALQVRVWNGWCSISGKSRGDIPKHVLVTSGYDPKKRKQLPHYALICHSDARLSLGKCGFLDPVQCRTFRNRSKPGPLQRAALLTRQSAHTGGYEIAFEASLVNPWYVKLVRPRLLSVSGVDGIRNYKDGDDWSALVRSLRPA
jgi:hypothetical protein